MGAERQDADPRGEPSAQARRGQIDPLADVDAVEEALVELVQLSFGHAGRGQPEGEQRELRLGEDLDPRHRAQPVRRQAGEGQLLLQLGAEGPRAVHLERQPDAQAAERPRELGRVLAEVHPVGIVLHPRHVVRRQAVGAAQRLAVARQDGAGAVGEEQSLVRIEHDRIRPLDPPHRPFPLFGQQEETAVGGVDVQP